MSRSCFFAGADILIPKLVKMTKWGGNSIEMR